MVGSRCAIGAINILMCRRAINPRKGHWTLPCRIPRAARDDHRRRRARSLGGGARQDRDRDAARGLCRAAHQPGAADVPRAPDRPTMSAPGRRVWRSACSASTRSRGTILPSPRHAGRCISSARRAIWLSSRRSPTRRARTGIFRRTKTDIAQPSWQGLALPSTSSPMQDRDVERNSWIPRPSLGMTTEYAATWRELSAAAAWRALWVPPAMGRRASSAWDTGPSDRLSPRDRSRTRSS